MSDKKIRYDQADIHYRLLGEGKPLMLVHGFGENSDVWDGILEPLYTGHQLLIPELPGSGRSGMIRDMSMEGMAACLKAILDQEGIRKVILIGHSMGGYITMAFAETFPDYLLSYGLFHSTAYADTEEKKATRRKGIQFINDHGAYEFLKTATPNLFSPQTREKNPGLVEKQISGLGNFSEDSLVTYYESMISRPDRREILKTSKVPVLFLAGRYDNAIPLEDVLGQCHLPELSYIHVLNQSGHMGMLEEPAECTQALRTFLLHQAE